MMCYLRNYNLVTDPLVSIIVTSKNSELYIEETLKSVIGQTYQNKEIIIIDANSKDSTLTKIQELQATDGFKSSFKISSEPDSGFHEGVCKGLNLASGDYIFTCAASDAFIDLNWIEKCISFLQLHQDYSLVWGFSINKYEETLRDISYPWLHRIGAPQGLAGFYYWLIFGTNFPEMNMGTRSEIMRKTFPKYVGDKSLKLDPWLEMMNNFHEGGYLAGHIDSIANFGRIHENSITKKNQEEKRNNLFELRYHWKRMILFFKIVFKIKKNHGKNLDLKYKNFEILKIYYLYWCEIKNFYGAKSLFLPFAALFFLKNVIKDTNFKGIFWR